MNRLTTLLILALVCTVLPAQEVTREMTNLALDLYDAVNKGRQEEADKLADKYLALCTSDKYRYGPFYAEAKHAKARSAAARGNFPLAQQLMDEVITARLDKRSKKNDDRLGLSYFDRSNYCFRQQNINQAISDLELAVEAYQKAKEHSKFATAMCQLAMYYKYRGAPGDVNREAECYEKAFPKVEKDTPEYLSVAAMMITAYNNQGKPDKASKLAKQLQKTGKKIAEKDPVRYADFLLSASVAEASNGEYDEALDYAKDAFQIYEDANRTSEHNYAVLMKNAADCHFHLQPKRPAHRHQA